MATHRSWPSVGVRSEALLGRLLVAASAALLVGGAAAALWPALLGLRRMGRLDLGP